MVPSEKNRIDTSPERAQDATIRLEFFRHDEFDKEDPTKKNREKILTQNGRRHAIEVGKTRNPHPEVGLVYNSPRVRTTDTALRQMLANEPEISENDTVEDIINKVRQKMPMGKKNIESESLNYNYGGSKAYMEAIMSHVSQSQDVLTFMLKESDAFCLKEYDSISNCYTRTAGKVAELVQKYIRVLPRWNQLTKEKPEQYAKFNNELQRFFGSHQMVPPCFLMKAIEKTEGPEAVWHLIESKELDKNGLRFSEGFSVVIAPKGDSATVEITFHDKHWTLTPEQVDEIIQEKNRFNKVCKSIEGLYSNLRT